MDQLDFRLTHSRIRKDQLSTEEHTHLDRNGPVGPFLCSAIFFLSGG